MKWFMLATVSALLSATAAVVQKRVLMRAHALEFSFLVSAVIMVLSLGVPFTVDVSPLPVSTLALIIAKSVMGGMAFLFVMTALERDQISSVLPLLGLTPAVTALLSWGVTGEVLKDWEWLGIGFMVAGTYLLERRPAGRTASVSSNSRISPSLYYVGAALALFAISSVADQVVVGTRKTDPRVVLLYQHVIYCVMFGALLWFRKVSFSMVVHAWRVQWPFLMAIAVVTIGYRFTQLEAVKDAPVALVLAVKRTSILYASLVGGKLFADKRLGVRLAGASLIVAAGFIILRNVS
jgi:drug/metabolite transporter (DMT)-like permease